MTPSDPRILVDDDPGILDALRMLFASEGYRVQTCAKVDYVESLRDAAGARPDVIVLDVLLFGKDGSTICRTLKSQEATRCIPVVMISAHPAAEPSVKEVGADAFVAKPFAIDLLLETVEGLLTRRAGEEHTSREA